MCAARVCDKRVYQKINDRSVSGVVPFWKSLGKIGIQVHV